MIACPAFRAERPELLIVVDTEEEFDWSAPFSRANVSTRSIPAQAAAHEIYDRLGIVPTYVLDHPVATDPAAVEFLGALRREGRAEIGAHLHPWVSPPHVEEVTTRNSYHCNLPPALERAKIEMLTATIAEAFGERPTIFNRWWSRFLWQARFALLARSAPPVARNTCDQRLCWLACRPRPSRSRFVRQPARGKIARAWAAGPFRLAGARPADTRRCERGRTMPVAQVFERTRCNPVHLGLSQPEPCARPYALCALRRRTGCLPCQHRRGADLFQGRAWR
jgi:hypothetical protein